jgi:hypothetical protein
MLGKSIYIWNISACLGGKIDQIVATLKAAKFDSIVLHETSVWGWATTARKQLAAALKAAGIAVYGGAAVYGKYPTDEGGTAAILCNTYGLEGFVFDAESAFDVVSKPDTQAVKLLQAFRKGAPAAKSGWCWWALWHNPDKPSTIYHPKSILWAAMDPNYGNADFGLPMDYWSWGNDAPAAKHYLDDDWAEWREVTKKPLVPIGRAYIGDGGRATPAAIAAFESEARRLGAVGVGWWSMQHALDKVNLPGVWDALAALPRFAPVADPLPYKTALPYISK